MKSIKTNNNCMVCMETVNNGVIVSHANSKGIVENSYIINDGDLIMLINYYNNCKNGVEESSYISK